MVNFNGYVGIIIFFNDFTGTRLHDSDHTNTYRKLEPHAAKWKDIGKALGFSEVKERWKTLKTVRSC